MSVKLDIKGNSRGIDLKFKSLFNTLSFEIVASSLYN